MIKFLILLILIVLFFSVSLTLGASNDQFVMFNYLFAQVEIRLSTLCAILFGSGFLMGWLLTGIFFLKVKLRLKATQHRLNKLQKSIANKSSSI